MPNPSNPKPDWIRLCLRVCGGGGRGVGWPGRGGLGFRVSGSGFGVRV